MSDSSAEETFLVIVQNGLDAASYQRAFIFQGSWEDVHKVPHSTEYVSIYLLAAAPEIECTPLEANFGQKLIHVTSLHPIQLALVEVEKALFHLSRLPPKQRLEELAFLLERFRRETLELKVLEPKGFTE